MLRQLLSFLGLFLVAVLARFYAPSFVAAAFFLSILVAYMYSEDEPFWLAFFLVLTDGFFGFFGNYEARLNFLPGLPPAEVGHFYIVLSIIKASKRKREKTIFYLPFLQVLAVYVCFLVVQSFAIGVSLSLKFVFTIFEDLIPFGLFYSIPRLFTSIDHYRQLFIYIFPAAISAFFAQAFTIGFSQEPMAYFGAKKGAKLAQDVAKGATYRGLYSPYILLMGYMGALVFLAYRKKTFSIFYLYGVIIAILLAIFLSATRGWVLSFSFMLFCFIVVVKRMDVRQLSSIVVMAALFLIGAFSVPILNTQLNNAYRRLMTLEALASGDLSAKGTLSRLEERGPRVMKRVKESPLTGLGYSRLFTQYMDGHVGNQNILLNAGIIGALLLLGFFGFFIFKMSWVNTRIRSDDPLKGVPLVFVFFLLGWFILHSSSRQFFGYHQDVPGGMVQVTFFCFAALIYWEALQKPQVESPAEVHELQSQES